MLENTIKVVQWLWYSEIISKIGQYDEVMSCVVAYIVDSQFSPNF